MDAATVPQQVAVVVGLGLIGALPVGNEPSKCIG